MANNDTQVVTVEEVLAYLGIDYADEMTSTNISRAIQTADRYLKGALGEDYPKEDHRCKELALIVVSDLYDNRGLQAQGGGTVSGNTRKLFDDFALQIRLELRRSADNG